MTDRNARGVNITLPQGFLYFLWNFILEHDTMMQKNTAASCGRQESEKGRNIV